MTRAEAVKIANILMTNFKMPVARNGLFESHVATDEYDRDILYIGAGNLGLHIDISKIEVVGKEKRTKARIEELESRPNQPRPIRLDEFLAHFPVPPPSEDHKD